MWGFQLCIIIKNKYYRDYCSPQITSGRDSVTFRLRFSFILFSISVTGGIYDTAGPFSESIRSKLQDY
jgi:hypothetical protein